MAAARCSTAKADSALPPPARGMTARRSRRRRRRSASGPSWRCARWSSRSGNCLSLRSGRPVPRGDGVGGGAREAPRGAARRDRTPTELERSSPSRAPPRSRTSWKACPRCSPTSGVGDQGVDATGDKVGTAKNIATACNILPPDARVTELTDEVYPQLKKIKQQDLIQAHPHPPRPPRRPPAPPARPAAPPLLTASTVERRRAPRGPVAGGSTNAEARVTHARSHRRAMARQMRRGGSARAHTFARPRACPPTARRPTTRPDLALPAPPPPRCARTTTTTPRPHST